MEEDGTLEDLLWLINGYDIQCLVVMWTGARSCFGVVVLSLERKSCGVSFLGIYHHEFSQQKPKQEPKQEPSGS
ncbi:hypothetical protein SAY87_011326 [Trapa incisa]|uniref:Uncharacterized protein n=2 Tax=Trapa TaxID=22665 RepID=A0AAN7MEF1_TRANT|nr:hypothetical protein SAY87_011326 [Trapa incisa]KAK4795428.1 hypothetical protein SAY86_013422 [Trapa natans]